MRSPKSRRRWRRTASAIKPRLRWAGAPPSGGFCKESRRLRESTGPRSTGAQVASGAQKPAAVDGGPATGHQPFGQVVGQIVSRRLVADLNKNNTLHPASQLVSRGERSYGAPGRSPLQQPDLHQSAEVQKICGIGWFQRFLEIVRHLPESPVGSRHQITPSDHTIRLQGPQRPDRRIERGKADLPDAHQLIQTVILPEPDQVDPGHHAPGNRYAECGTV